VKKNEKTVNRRTPENTSAARQPDGKWKDGQSGNPGGRPKKKASIAYWLNEFAQMTGAGAARACIVFAAEFKKAKGDLPLAAVIAARTLLQLMNDPDPRLLAQVLDRIDGKVSQPVTITYQQEIAELLRAGAVTPQQVRAEVGDDLAAELFALAGVAVNDDASQPE